MHSKDKASICNIKRLSARWMRPARLGLAVALTMVLIAGHFVAPAALAASDDPGLLAQLGENIADVVEKASPAVVQVESITQITVRSPWERFEEMLPPQLRRQMPEPEQQVPRMGLGSGFIIDSGGIILTNNHVVEQSDEIKVVLSNGEEYKAEVLGSDPESEVAVIRIDAENLPVLEAADSDTLRPGNFVLAIGSPQGLTQSVSLGIVSATNRTQIGVIRYGFENFIQTDAAVNRGNSGGPLLDAHGRVVGINTAIISTSGGSQGLGLAVPINDALKIADILREHGEVKRGYLGVNIRDLEPEMAEYLDVDVDAGVLILDVVDGMPAEGILEPDDVVIEVDGQRFKDTSQFMRMIASHSPGDEVTLTVVRHGKEKQLDITLGTRPSQRDLLAGRLQKDEPGRARSEDVDLGFTVKRITEDEAAELGYADQKGLLVVEVETSSQAFRKGLRKNMLITQVNQQDVETPADLRKALKENADKDKVLLRVHSPMGAELMLIPKE